METLLSILTKHKQEIKLLQKNCRHPIISGFVPVNNLRASRVCIICGKEIEIAFRFGFVTTGN